MTNEEFLSMFKGGMQYAAGDDAKVAGKEQPWKNYISPDEIPALNKKKYGIYFYLNKFPRGIRKKDMCIRIHCIFVDDDHTGHEVKNWPLEPSAVVQTSPGKFNYYWMTTTTEFETYDRVQQTLVNDYGGDKNARDIARVLRVPGTYHCKGRRFRVKVIGGNGKRYAWSRILKAFPPADSKQSNFANKETGKYDISVASEQFITGEDFHGCMKSISMSYVERGRTKGDFIETMKPLYMAAKHTITDQERLDTLEQRMSEKHIDECWNSAMRNKSRPAVIKRKNIVRLKTPLFPDNPMEGWPEPWPLIWEEWQKLPRKLSPELLMPTVLTAHSYFLNSIYVGEWGMRPNMAFLGIAGTTANKDINSKSVLRQIRDIIKRDGHIDSPFFRINNGADSVSSSTAFLKSIDKEGNLFWINTEATHLFQQMAQAGGSNSSVKELESKIIAVVDGHEIQGKKKATEEMMTIEDPNCQILLYTQPETISEYLNSNTIDSGLLGRMIVTVHAGEGGNPFSDTFIENKNIKRRMNRSLLDLYKKFPEKSNGKIKVIFNKKNRSILQEWMLKFDKLCNGNEGLIKVLKRMEITAEQLYTLVFGIASLWQEQKGGSFTNFNPSVLFPILNYWAECKVYAIKEYVDSSIDPLSEAVIETMKQLISGDLKVQANYKKNVSKYNAVPVGEIIRVISNKRKLIRILENSNDKRNVHQRILSCLAISEKFGIVIKVDVRRARVPYYGFPEE